jgi:O-acetyl-ADP-ribose deacetylase (regulator of RNase III)
LGEARMTGAGKLGFDHIIHVTGINMLWFATQYSVTQSVINAMAIVNEHKISSVAFPLIGSGSGNRGKQWSLDLMLKAFEGIRSEAEVVIVQYP